MRTRDYGFVWGLGIALAMSCSSSTTTTDNDQEGQEPANRTLLTGNKNPLLNTGSDDPETGQNVKGSGLATTGESIVYAHSPATLYRFDTKTNVVSKVGDFSLSQDVGSTHYLESITDIALDKHSNGFAIGFKGLYRLDLSSGELSLLKDLPLEPARNSLSFLPEGTLEAGKETLVGIYTDKYVSINTETGESVVLGSLPEGFISSGDIVSVKGGGTFLTVCEKEVVNDIVGCKRRDATCLDCLVQLNPTNGAILQNYGPIGLPYVYGLAFWGGKIYGFSLVSPTETTEISGSVVEVFPENGIVKTKKIAVTLPGNLAFPWSGAGSTTVAPVADEKGNTIPIQIH